LARPVTRIGTPGGAKSFLRGAKIFKLSPTDFSRGAKRFAREASHPFPLVTGLCPILLNQGSRTFLAKGAMKPIYF